MDKRDKLGQLLVSTHTKATGGTGVTAGRAGRLPSLRARLMGRTGVTGAVIRPPELRRAFAELAARASQVAADGELA